MAKRPRGRPAKLTPELIAQVGQLIGVCPFETTIAAALGIAPRTLYNWRKWGERERQGLYHDFFLTVS